MILSRAVLRRVRSTSMTTRQEPSDLSRDPAQSRDELGQLEWKPRQVVEGCSPLYCCSDWVRPSPAKLAEGASRMSGQREHHQRAARPS